MKFPPISVLVIGSVLLALGFWAGMWFSGSGPLVSSPTPTPLSAVKPDGEREEIYLYFSDATEEYLSAETRKMVLKGSPEERAHIIFESLAAGPAGEGITPLPGGTALLALYMDGDMAVLDLDPAIRENHPGGSHAELHTIYALVNSLVLNVPEIRRVKILIAGQEQDTLAGHIDIRHPLTANMMIVR